LGLGATAGLAGRTGTGAGAGCDHVGDETASAATIVTAA